MSTQSYYNISVNNNLSALGTSVLAALTSTTAAISGALTAGSAAVSGALSAASATFSGLLTANAGANLYGTVNVNGPMTTQNITVPSGRTFTMLGSMNVFNSTVLSSQCLSYISTLVENVQPAINTFRQQLTAISYSGSTTAIAGDLLLGASLLTNGVTLSAAELGSLDNNTQNIAGKFSALDATDTSLAAGISANAGLINANIAAISTLNGEVATNTASIAANAASIATINGEISTINGEVAANTAGISANTASIATNAASIATINGEISTINGEVATNTASIAANTASIATNSASIASLQTATTGLTYNSSTATSTFAGQLSAPQVLTAQETAYVATVAYWMPSTAGSVESPVMHTLTVPANSLSAGFTINTPIAYRIECSGGVNSSMYVASFTCKVYQNGTLFATPTVLPSGTTTTPSSISPTTGVQFTQYRYTLTIAFAPSGTAAAVYTVTFTPSAPVTVGSGSTFYTIFNTGAVTSAWTGSISAHSVDLPGYIPVGMVESFTSTRAGCTMVNDLIVGGNVYFNNANKLYDSGWFPVALNTNYTITHNLGLTSDNIPRYQILYSNTAAPVVLGVSTVIDITAFTLNYGCTDGFVLQHYTNYIALITGPSCIAHTYNNSGASQTSGWYRLKLYPF